MKKLFTRLMALCLMIGAGFLTNAQTTLQFSYNPYGDNDYTWQTFSQDIFNEGLATLEGQDLQEGQTFNLKVSGTAPFAGWYTVALIDNSPEAGGWTPNTSYSGGFWINAEGDFFSESIELTITEVTAHPQLWISYAFPDHVTAVEKVNGGVDFEKTSDAVNGFDFEFSKLNLQYLEPDARLISAPKSEWGYFVNMDDIMPIVPEGWEPQLKDKFLIHIEGVTDFTGSATFYLVDDRAEVDYYGVETPSVTIDVVAGVSFKKDITLEINQIASGNGVGYKIAKTRLDYFDSEYNDRDELNINFKKYIVSYISASKNELFNISDEIEIISVEQSQTDESVYTVTYRITANDKDVTSVKVDGDEVEFDENTNTFSITSDFAIKPSVGISYEPRMIAYKLLFINEANPTDISEDMPEGFWYEIKSVDEEYHVDYEYGISEEYPDVEIPYGRTVEFGIGCYNDRVKITKFVPNIVGISNNEITEVEYYYIFPTMPNDTYAEIYGRNTEIFVIYYSAKSITVAAQTSTYGTIYPAGETTVEYGQKKLFAFVPEEGYEFTSCSISNIDVFDYDGVSYLSDYDDTYAEIVEYAQTLTEAQRADVRFIVIENSADNATIDEENYNLSASFAKKEFTITATGEHGTVGSESVKVEYGDNYTVIFTPNEGYKVEDVLVDGESVGAVESYTFENVTAAHTVSVMFSIKSFSISATAGEHGKVSSALTEVEYSDNYTVTFTPDEGYKVAEVLIDGESVGIVEEYTFENVTANHIVEVTFKENIVYSITASGNEHGVVLPNVSSVENGNNQLFVFIPKVGCTLEAVSLDGATLDKTQLIDLSKSIDGDFYNKIYSKWYAENGGFFDTARVEDYNSMGMYCYYLENADANHAIEVTFKKHILYDVTVTVGENGTALTTPTKVMAGENYVAVFYPKYGYEIDAVTLDSKVIDGKNLLTNEDMMSEKWKDDMDMWENYNGETLYLDYTFFDVYDGSVALAYVLEDVVAPHSFNVTFKERTFDFEKTIVGDGTITASQDVVKYGSDVTYTFTPNEGSYLADVTIDGLSKIVLDNSYRFENVTENHSIAVTFAKYTFDISATAGSNGDVNSTSKTVEYGDNYIVIIAPEVGYKVDEVTVDDVVTTELYDMYTEIEELSDEELAALIEAEISFVENIPAEVLADVRLCVFKKVTENHSVSATFAVKTFDITVTANGNGTVSPSGDVNDIVYGSDQTFTFTPDEGYEIAYVLVDGKNVGVVESYTFENLTANHSIEVVFDLPGYTFVEKVTGDGTISPEIARVKQGENQDFIFTANEGSYIADVKVNGESVGAVESYSFIDVKEAFTIEVVFAKYTFDITVIAGDNGAVIPATSTVEYGDNQLVMLLSKLNYEIDAVTLDDTVVINKQDLLLYVDLQKYMSDEELTSWSESNEEMFMSLNEEDYSYEYSFYVLENITDAHTIAVTFRLQQFEISADEVENGTIETAMVEYGANKTISIIPDEGYEIEEVFVDGESVGVVESYTFENVTAAHTVSATFSIKSFNISTTAGNNGMVVPGEATVEYGSDKTFTFIPDEGYKVEDVLIDGESVGAVTSYTFEKVSAEHTVSVTFVEGTADAIDEVVENAAVVYANNYTIFVKNATDVVTIFDINGHRLAQADAEDNTMEFAVRMKGVYFVTVGAQSFSVIVK